LNIRAHGTRQDLKLELFIEFKNEITIDPWRSSSSLPHLIRTKNMFLSHIYTRKYENEIEKW
jgi:hypothetical protein